MLTVSEVSKSYAGKKLFIDVSTSFAPANRYGLSGPNGAGKSTFMKILDGGLDPDKGTVSRPRKTAFLKQDHTLFNDNTALDTVIMGNGALWAAQQEQKQIYESGDHSDEAGMRLAELEGVIAEENGYVAESEAEELLQGLGIPAQAYQSTMRELSGGQKLRVLLAQALFGQPDCLLLDEPTNHLDLDSIEWLEEFLLNYQGILIVISHDRRFLNDICTHIADIDFEVIITYPGNYDDMVRTKSAMRERQAQQTAAREKKITDLKDFIAKFSAGTRASQVQSRKKLVEKLQPADIKRSNIARPFIRFDLGRESGKHVVDFEDLTHDYGNGDVFEPFRAHVNRGERIGVIGKDGAGKTTLLRILAGELKSNAGRIERGHEAQWGYLPQEHESTIEPGKTIDTWLHDFKPGADLEDVRGLLGRMLFRGDEGLKATATLSGGERVRMLFCRLMLLKFNTLALDEPTNHLDLEGCSALSEGLAEYKGTLFVATHDRNLLSESCTRIWYIKDNTILDFAGRYDEFAARYGH
ncbi:MAG: ABC-F family ATP-binding cassette domain-containing protein [Myxococcales bacterium]|nr:ABC-F family ATP-binding cassette domain-containing protein [Myxococcales bacterium]